MRLRERTVALAACAILAAGASAAVGDAAAQDARPVRPPSATGPLGDERLSDEERVSRWANAVLRAPVHRKPAANSPLAGRLRLQTEDGPLEVYLVLASRLDGAGRSWVRVRLPGRPNGRTGWVLRDSLGDLHVVRTKLRVNRATLRATLYRDGRSLWSSPVGVGKAATPTPGGRFWIRTRLRNLGGKAIYGPLAFGTGAYSVLSDWPGGGVVGIHGTNEPSLIPGRPSHGCVRVPNDRIRRLAELMPIGTPVEIV
ncbi:MAG TPA: L,D-transpeptidase [Solirubrobacteraceae bacterium]